MLSSCGCFFLFLIVCNLLFRSYSQPYSVTTRPAKEYATAQARASLEETWGTRVEELLDSLTDDEAVSVGSLLNYVNFTQKGELVFCCTCTDSIARSSRHFAVAPAIPVACNSHHRSSVAPFVRNHTHNDGSVLPIWSHVFLSFFLLCLGCGIALLIYRECR